MPTHVASKPVWQNNTHLSYQYYECKGKRHVKEFGDLSKFIMINYIHPSPFEWIQSNWGIIWPSWWSLPVHIIHSRHDGRQTICIWWCLENPWTASLERWHPVLLDKSTNPQIWHLYCLNTIEQGFVCACFFPHLYYVAIVKTMGCDIYIFLIVYVWWSDMMLVIHRQQFRKTSLLSIYY